MRDDRPPALVRLGRTLAQPPWRTFVLLLLLAGAALAAWTLWQPGRIVRDGRHDRRTNGLWMTHAWLGDDGWFRRKPKYQPASFRDPERLRTLAAELEQRGIRDLFPHLCPCSPEGELAPSDPAQVERFLEALAPGRFRVLPWIGGPRGLAAFPGDAEWRRRFAASVRALLEAHPRLAGVHLNIEPMPSGDRDFLTLLRELRVALPPGKLLSVAAYPPPTRWQPSPEIHWEEAYFRQVAGLADQMAVMMYDTGIRWRKPYTQLMAAWAEEILAWTPPATEVLFGVPAYEDAGAGYHEPGVENLATALAGLHAALARHRPLPVNYRGLAIYSDWEMTEAKWQLLWHEFLSSGSSPPPS